MLITSSWIIDFVLLIAATSFFVYKYATRKFGYWKKRGVYYPKPVPFLGNISDIAFLRTNLGYWLKKLYDSTDEPYFGIFVFDEPHLILKSTALIKQILVKDFSNFDNRTISNGEHHKIMKNMMFLQKNPEWREGRSKLTTVFTSGKLKSMYPLIETIGENLVTHLTDNSRGDVEVKEVAAKYATDVISTCFFGIDAYSLQDENGEFRKQGKEIFESTWRNAISQTSYWFRPNWVKMFKLYFVPEPVLDYFHGAFSKAIQARSKTGNRRNDLVDILNDMKKSGEFNVDMDLESEEIIGPAVQFFAAGFETTSATISFALHELCLHKDIQGKLRAEVLASIKEHGGLTYDGLMGMKYMDMCIKETLRMYPVLSFLDRRCNKDYRLPGTDLIIEKGMPVYIPMFGLHLDEKYYPEPMKFDPERFRDMNYNKDGFVYIPFGEGPRICIGERFAMLSTKTALAYILTNFELEKCARTPNPVIFDNKSVALRSIIGLPMRFTKISPMSA